MQRESLGVGLADGEIEGGLGLDLAQMLFVDVGSGSRCANLVSQQLQQNGLGGAQMREPRLCAGTQAPRAFLAGR